MGVYWKPDQDQALLKLIGEGKTFAWAAAILGVSRDSVAGRLKKLRQHRPPPTPRPRLAVVLGEPEPLLKTLWELGADDCKWPVNDGGPFLFCAHPRDGRGGPYCGYHAGISTTKHTYWGQR